MEKDKQSLVSSVSHRSPLLGSERIVDTEGTPLVSSNSQQSRGHTSHPSRTLKDRLGSPVGRDYDSNLSKSGDGPSALERISDPIPVDDENSTRVHISYSGRLRYVEVLLDSDDLLGPDEDAPAIPDPPPPRISTNLHLGSTTNASVTKVRRTIPISPMRKAAGKRRVTRSATKKRNGRSPLQSPNLRKSTTARSSGVACRKFYAGKANALPCNKDGSTTSKATGTSSKSVRPKTMIIPGITKGRAEFRSPPNPLP